MGSHRLTQCYLPPDTSERAPPNPSHAGWYSIYLRRRDGRLSWPSWLDSAPAGSRTSDLSTTGPTSTTAPLRHHSAADFSRRADFFHFSRILAVNFDQPQSRTGNFFSADFPWGAWLYLTVQGLYKRRHSETACCRQWWKQHQNVKTKTEAEASLRPVL